MILCSLCTQWAAVVRPSPRPGCYSQRILQDEDNENSHCQRHNHRCLLLARADAKGGSKADNTTAAQFAALICSDPRTAARQYMSLIEAHRRRCARAWLASDVVQEAGRLQGC